MTFNGTPAPLLWVQDSQINAIVPWSLTPGGNTEICVLSGGVRTNCLTWPVVLTAPAVFTVDGSYALPVNQDGSINSAKNPAAIGSIVAVWPPASGRLTRLWPMGRKWTFRCPPTRCRRASRPTGFYGQVV